ncbi:RNA 2'-phosphotransferase [Leptobacterium flavescens]|uniref:Probable RNA 2'-phosphotransferase n=1 Tax=Leptobacterium flavescens TaxID=472055 RepID=A0A6P0UM02_9FLAO|nr:RNA 2'-phosphotransferase [Leptobacterium flavescens]NER14264.1 RNA 2'-phosphotransferase [Leptobacterium flavescens]
MGIDHKKISKFLSLVLRHRPDKIDLQLDKEGWAVTQELLEKAKKHFPQLDTALLTEIVESNDKQRFSFNSDGSRIRASQGHSLTVDLGYSPKLPPEFLYHGTVEKFLDPIKQNGLLKMSRHHVHLSRDTDTAIKVGSRRGKAIILRIRAAEMHKDGMQFYESENGVWLTDQVPASYIEFKEN